MIVVVILSLVIAALWIDALWRLALAALLWLPVLFCAVAAMHWTASLHLADPLAPLYAFAGSGVLGRLLLELALCSIRRPRH
jgi:hypothetical protein